MKGCMRGRSIVDGRQQVLLIFSLFVSLLLSGCRQSAADPGAGRCSGSNEVSAVVSDQDQDPSASPVQTSAGLASGSPAAPTASRPPQGLIAIDAGHGGNDVGADATMNGLQLHEKNITLSIAHQIEEILTRQGYSVYMVRSGEENPDRRDRIRAANAKKAALYISIHCDWFGDPFISGSTFYYSSANNSTYRKLTHRGFAEIMHRNMTAVSATVDRGIREKLDFAVLRLAEMPSVLIETGYMSNPGDIQRLADPAYQARLAAAAAQGAMEALQVAGP